MADHFATQHKLTELANYSLYDIAGEFVDFEEKIETLKDAVDDLENRLADALARVDQ